MKNSLPPPISEFLIFLKNNKFFLVEEDFSSSFCDAFFVFQKDSFLIRLISDKSIWRIEIRNAKISDWYDLSLIKEFISKNETDLVEIKNQIDYFKKNQKKLEKIFKKENLKKTTVYLEKQKTNRLKRLFPKIFK